MQPKSRRVGAVTLNWNGMDDTVACVHSVLRQTYPAVRVYIVDNASTNHEAEQLRALFAGNQRVTVIANPQNAGYAGGNNLGIRQALADGCAGVWLLNNDATADPQALDRAWQRLQESGAGIVGCTILYPDGQTVYALGGGVMNFLFGTDRLIGARQPVSQAVPTQRLDYISGASMLIDRRVLDRIGLFDERFFLYSEEADLCRRAVKAGFTLSLSPKAIIHHASAKSTGHFSDTYIYYFLRNKILLQKKHGRPWQWLTFWPTYFVYLCGGMFVLSLIRTGRWSVGIIWKAIWDGLIGRYGYRQLSTNFRK